jgi:hypothetical protein
MEKCEMCHEPATVVVTDKQSATGVKTEHHYCLRHSRGLVEQALGKLDASNLDDAVKAKMRAALNQHMDDIKADQ